MNKPKAPVPKTLDEAMGLNQMVYGQPVPSIKECQESFLNDIKKVRAINQSVVEPFMQITNGLATAYPVFSMNEVIQLGQPFDLGMMELIDIFRLWVSHLTKAKRLVKIPNDVMDYDQWRWI